MHLRTLLAITFLLTAGVLQAQSTTNGTDPKNGIPVRNLGVCFLNAASTPDIYFKDALGEYKPLQIDTTRFDNWNIVPASTQLQLYKKIPTPPATGATPEDKPTYEPVQTWTLPEGTDSIRKLYYYGSQGQVNQMNFPVDAESHGAMQIKIFNLLDSPAMIRLDKQQQIIPPGEQIVLTAASALEERFQYQFAFQADSEPSYISPSINLRFVTPTQRMTVIIGYLPVTDQPNSRNTGPNRYEANSIRFYEDIARLPAPAEPVIRPLR
jgi:hypothetical protein